MALTGVANVAQYMLYDMNWYANRGRMCVAIYMYVKGV